MLSHTCFFSHFSRSLAASTIYLLIICAPNGISDSFANFKNCFPKGIPIIVMYKIQPIARWPRAIHNPKKINHIILAIVDTAPPPYITSFPNGQNDRLANLKHCFPYGIPMMVMHHSIPDKIQDKPLSSPPNNSHSMFPKVPILYVPLLFDTYASLTNDKWRHPLRIPPSLWWSVGGSNPWPQDCERWYIR